MTQEERGDINIALEEKGKASPPYISFLMFNNNFLSWIEGEGIPLKFDRSFWGKKFSGTGGLQLMAGLRFLGLLKDDVPQPKLEDIVKAKGEDRKALLAKMIRDAYAKVDFQQLDRATPSMVNGWIKDYGLDGSTLRKAVSFFINACKVYDIPLSNHLKKIARNKQTRSATPKSQKKQDDGQLQKKAPKVEPLPGNVQKGQIYKIKFNSAGEMTLVVDLPVFEMSSDDRDFALKMVDMVKGYNLKK